MKLKLSGVLVLIGVLAAGSAQLRAAQPGGWIRLGSATADFSRDRDIIHVKGSGAFRELMFRVDGSELEMYNFVVTFGNSERFSPETRARFEPGSWSRNIDLPGQKRAIKSIAFHYRSLKPRTGKATVTVFGR